MQMIVFKNWESVLAASGMSARRKQSYLITIRWYLGYLCRGREAATVASARAFFAWAKQEKQPPDWLAERWKDALRWFFSSAPMRKEAGRERMAVRAPLMVKAGNQPCESSSERSSPLAAATADVAKQRLTWA